VKDRQFKIGGVFRILILFQYSMMKRAKPEIRVGARGWQFKEWGKEFYPDDLPQDWRFSYYSNEFNAVLIPYEYLSNYSLEDWQEWKEDTAKDFYFYVEISESAQWSNIKPYLQILGEQLIGVIVVVETLEHVAELANLINKVKQLAPVNLKRAGTKITDKDMVTLQACHEVNECWDGEGNAPVWGYSGTATILRESGEQNTPEKVRQIIETGLESAGKCEVLALFFTGPAPKVSDINSSRMITELLV